MKVLSIIAFLLVFLTGSMGHAQELELSAGMTYKSLLGKQRQLYAPVLGFEMGAARQEQAPFSADMIAWGANVGVFRMHRSDTEGVGQSQQIVETKATFRYDYYYNDYFSFYYGADAGFSFTTLQSDQPMMSSETNSTQLFTRGIIAPNGGINFEINRYIALYYKLQYDLGKYFGPQPSWGNPSSKWNHLVTQTAGLRVRFW